MATPSLNELREELTARIQSTTTFRESGFHIFDMDDLIQWREQGARLPMAGIAYEGADVIENQGATNRVSGGSNRVNTLKIRFSVVIAMDYRGVSGDRKKDALSLLQEVRDVLQGYRGVNSRPWALLTEQPMNMDIEGVIFYAQLWATDSILTGNFAET